jgi:hypothetical protein
MIRLSFRDIWRYCYLDQTHLDSSFFHLEDPFRGRKSQDAMRFFTGLYSERLSQLEDKLNKTIDEQRSKREAVQQLRTFTTRFELGSEHDIVEQLQTTEHELIEAEQKRAELEQTRSAQIHPSDALRDKLRYLSSEIENFRNAIVEETDSISEQRALRSEFITAKTKTVRSDQARKILEGVSYQRCPECGSALSSRPHNNAQCHLCGSVQENDGNTKMLEHEALRRDLNERIDQIADSISRREQELKRMEKQLVQAQQQKESFDRQLQDELARYDSAFVESIRDTERQIATLTERIKSLKRLQQLPLAISTLEEEAGALQGRIDRARSSITEERDRLRAADANIAAIAREFKRVMLSVSFPGVSEDDEVVIDPRNWKPTIVHGDQEWTFWDTGSGGKKTLFNVCYALSIHTVALERKMPMPSVLIIDSPTKNISEDENPDLVRSLYNEIYQLARGQKDRRLQFLLIDSDMVPPLTSLPGFSERRMDGSPNAPSLIPYYIGP